MKSKPVVLIIPGHGGWSKELQKYMTDGKRSKHKVDGSFYYEGVENRKIAKEWAGILRNQGFQVKFIVDPDDHRDVPLSERVEIENRLNRSAQGNCVVIEIHSNAASNPSAQGHEVYTAPGESPADPLAQCWHETLHHFYPEMKKRTDNTDGDADKEAYFYTLTRTKSPHILIELGFHTNDDDVRLMRNWKFRLSTGIALGRAITKWHKEL